MPQGPYDLAACQNDAIVITMPIWLAVQKGSSAEANLSVAIEEIIAGRSSGSHEQPAHHRYIVTLFGLYARPAGKALPVSLVVELMSELGCEPASVRSSISRLKKRGVLVSTRVKGANGYALSPDLEPHMLAGDERIFAPRAASMGDPWLLASFSVPESERQHRHKIRSGLTRIGFGTVASGLCIAPARLRAEAIDYMQSNGLSGYVEFFLAEPTGPGDLEHKISQWWDLDEQERGYRAFVERFEPETEYWLTHDREDANSRRKAFQTYVPLITQWRRLPYLDPGLPLELLPNGWMGINARRLFGDLNRVLKPMAAEYIDGMIGA